MSRSRYEGQMPGHVATATQPGTAVPSKLRAIAARGDGVLGEAQRRANLLFRIQKKKRPDPHVVTIEDVTKGMGIDSDLRERVHRTIRDTRADYGQHPQLRAPRLTHARLVLMGQLRVMQELDSTQRMEIARRAMMWWKRNVVTDMKAKPKIRYVVSKSQQIGKRLSATEKKELLSAKAKKDFPPKGSTEDKDGIPNQLDRRSKEDLRGAPKGNPEDDDVKDEHKVKGMEVEDFEEEDDEDDKKKGKRVKFHGKVDAHLPEDADFHHHITEHSKHVSGYLVHKEADPKRAEAHRHAANLHARIGNALHAAGETQKNEPPQKEPPPFLQDPENAAEGSQSPEAGEPPFRSKNGATGASRVPSGKDLSGKPVPEKPDAKRNPPGRDSDIEAKKRMVGKYYIRKGQYELPFSLMLVGG